MGKTGKTGTLPFSIPVCASCGWSANTQVGSFPGAFVGDEAQELAVLLHQLAVAREHLVTGFQRAAEIALIPGQSAADIAAEGASADAARWADGQTYAQTAQAFA